MILTPDAYYSIRQKGATDKQLAEELSREAGLDVNEALARGLSYGQIARYYSGIDEVQYQNTQNPVENRSGLGTTFSSLAKGVVNASRMWGEALKVSDPDGGLSVGDLAGDAILSIADKAESRLDILKPDVAEVTGQDGLLKRGYKGTLEAAPLAISTMLPAILAAPFTGGSSLAVGAISFTGGATIYGLGSYGQAAKDMKVANPNATDQEVHDYALKIGFTEGGLEAASNVLTMGILKLARPAGVSVGDAIKQIIKTPKATLAKMWGLETLQEVGTESLQGGLGAKVSQEAGVSDVSVKEGVVESIIPAALMSSIFWLGGTSLNASRKRTLLKQLNDPDFEKRTQAATAVKNLLVKEKEPEIAAAWKQMTDDRIKQGQSINIHQDILNFDPNAKETEQEANITETQEEAVDIEDVSLDTEEPAAEGALSMIQEGDILPYRSKKPYKTRQVAENVIKSKPVKLVSNEEYEAIEVQDGFVIRKKVVEQETKLTKKTDEQIAKAAGLTIEEYKALKPDQKEQVKQEASSVIVEAKGKPETLTPDAVVEEVNTQVPGTDLKFDGEQDRAAIIAKLGEVTKTPEASKDTKTWNTDSTAWKKLGLKEKHDRVKEQTIVDTNFEGFLEERKVLDTFSSLDKDQQERLEVQYVNTVNRLLTKKANGYAKKITLPYKQSNESVEELTPWKADELREETRLTKIQQRAVEQINESMLDENKLVPWPVTHQTTKAGQKLSANLEWINQKAIDALPKEEKPKSAVTAATLISLEKKGFIKQAYYKGMKRWVPADWKAPTEKKTVLRKAEPKVTVKRALENGDIIEVEVHAKEALQETNEQLEALENLITCME